MTTFRRLLTILLVAGLTASAVAASTAPAGAAPGALSTDPPCEWADWGTSSACDGIHPWGVAHRAECGTGGFVDTVEIRASSLTVLAYVDLVYERGPRTTYPNGNCRTAWAELTVVNDNVSYCRAEIRRNSDGQKYEVYGAPGHQQTAVVHDAGVTSYAWGICFYQGSYFTARTINY